MRAAKSRTWTTAAAVAVFAVVATAWPAAASPWPPADVAGAEPASPLLASVDVELEPAPSASPPAAITATPEVELALEAPRSWTHLEELERLSENVLWALEASAPRAVNPCESGRLRLKTRVRGYQLFRGGNGAVVRPLVPVIPTGFGVSCTAEASGGVFTTTDPLGYVDGPNLYQYGLNNPVNFSDPMGLCVGQDLGCTADFAWEFTKGVGGDVLDLGMGLGDQLSGGASAEVRCFAEAYQATGDFNTAYAAGARCKQAAVTLGFSEAEDPLAHANELVGFGGIARGGTLIGRGIGEGDSDLIWRGVGEALGGTGQFAGLLAGAGGGARALAGRSSAGTSSYLTSSRRIARFEAHFNRIRRQGGVSGERLAEFRGRLDMLEFGYVKAGPSKLIGNLRSPGRGRGTQGFDQVFRRVGDSSDLAILESKFSHNFRIGNDPTRLLSQRVPGQQMSHPWVEMNIQKMITGPHNIRVNTLGWRLGNNGYARYLNVLNAAGESMIVGLPF